MDDLNGVIEAVDDYGHDSDRICACVQCDSDGAVKSMTQGQRGRVFKFISQEDIRLDMSVRLMICLFVLERRLFDMCSWGRNRRIERNVRLEGSVFFSILREN